MPASRGGGFAGQRLLGSLVLVAATWLFGVYVQNFSSYDRTYGSLAGVMVLLVWFWVSWRDSSNRAQAGTW